MAQYDLETRLEKSDKRSETTFGFWERFKESNRDKQEGGNKGTCLKINRDRTINVTVNRSPPVGELWSKLERKLWLPRVRVLLCLPILAELFALG